MYAESPTLFANYFVGGGRAAFVPALLPLPLTACATLPPFWPGVFELPLLAFCFAVGILMVGVPALP
jgi:hypothetical protein